MCSTREPNYTECSARFCKLTFCKLQQYNTLFQTIDVNTYQQKKNLAQGMMDLALLSANANQLRYVLESASSHPYYYPSLVFISLSIIFQVSYQFMNFLRLWRDISSAVIQLESKHGLFTFNSTHLRDVALYVRTQLCLNWLSFVERVIHIAALLPLMELSITCRLIPPSSFHGYFRINNRAYFVS